MSEFSQALSTCSRTTDFSFVFNNSAFSDAVLVLLTLRPKGVSIPWRLASSVAQLFVSAVEVSATTLTNTVTVGDSWYAAGKALGSLGQTVVSRLSPKDCQEVAIATVYQVNSALLAASSPYLRHLIQHPPQLQHLVPGLASVVSRHKQRKLVTVLIQPHHVSAAEAVVKFIFTNDIALTSAQQALDALLVAEQLQVPDCAEVCQHYLEDCQMDWPVALTLVHLQHKHQQEQQHQRQQKWQQQQQQQQQHGGGGPHKGSSGSSVVTGRRSGPRGSLQRNSMGTGLLRGGRGGSGGPVNSLDAVAPLLPVPSESVYLQGLLLRAQDFLVDQFEDLEVVLGSAEGRQRLLLLPYDALRAILGHPRLQVASENTALLAAAAWLHANAAQVSSLLLSPNSSAAAAAAAAAAAGGGSSIGGGGLGLRQSSGGADAPVRSQTVYSSALYSSSNGRAGEDPGSSSSSIAAAHTGANSNSTEGLQNGVLHNTAAAATQQQQPPTASGVGSLLLDLCQVLRVCQCSYTYVMHILPHLPLFRDEPQLVSALQFEVLRFRAAGKLRQRRLAAEAAAAAAAAAAAGSNSSGLTGHHLAGLEHQQQQQQQQGLGVNAVGIKAPAGGTGSDSSSTELAKAPAANGVLGEVKPVGGVSGGGAQGWRSGCTADAALLQCQLRPDSARSTLDFSFTFDPQALQAGTEGQGGGKGGSAAGAAAGSNGCSSGSSAGVDLMQRLLGLAATQQQDATLVSEDQFFAGYVWNMVVAHDGFVGVSWRVVLPGGGVPLTAPQAAQHQQVAAAAAVAPEGWGAAAGHQGLNYSSVRVFGPDCAGFRSPEVAVTFSITSSGLGRGQRNSSSSGSLAAAAGGSTAATAATVTAGGADAAAVKPGSKADQSLPHTGYVNSSSTGSGKGNQQQQQQQGGGNMVSGSPLKGGKVVGRAYSEVQFVPAHCAWGFPDFADPGGWDALKGPDGKVCLRCQLRHRE